MRLWPPITAALAGLAVATGAAGQDPAPPPEAPPAEPPAESPTPEPSALPLVIVDPGHGGKDGGASGILPAGIDTGLPPRRDGRGRVRILEKDVNLDVAIRLEGYFRGRGYPTAMTRTKDRAGGDRPFTTESADLRARVRLANRAARAHPDRAALFISVHSNAFRTTSRGTETFHFYSARRASRRLARLVHGEVVLRLGLPDRGVQRAGFYVLRKTTMPAILLEGAFLSNPREALLLARPEVRQTLAEGAGAGVERYVREAPSPPPPEPAPDGATPPAEPPTIRYWVTAGLFTTSAAARRRSRLVERRGFETIVRRRHSERLDRDLFHVVTGQFIFLQNAKRMRGQLRRRGLPGRIGSASGQRRRATTR